MKPKLETKEITLGHAEIISMPERAVVHEHKATGAKYTAFAFAFPDGTPATIVITKGIRSKWQPSQDVRKIIIEFTQ